MRRRLPRRLEGRHANDGIVQPWRLRWLIVLLVLLGVFIVAFMIFFIAGLFEPQTLESGRGEIRAMKSDLSLASARPGPRFAMKRSTPRQGTPWGGISYLGAAVKAIAVEVEGVLAQPTVEECLLVNASRHPVFIVEER